MTARRISIEAYHAHRDGGLLGAQQLAILKFLAHNAQRDYTRAELAEATGIRLSSVCGRVKELMDLHVLEEGERRMCAETGHNAHPLSMAAVQAELPL